MEKGKSERFTEFINHIFAGRSEEKKCIYRGLLRSEDWKNLCRSQKHMDIMTAKAIMQRCGIVSAQCEFIVTKEEYEYLCLRKKIWETYEKWDEEAYCRLKQDLEHYQKRGVLYRQFLEEMEARWMMRKGADSDQVEKKLYDALALTNCGSENDKFLKVFWHSGEMRLLELIALCEERKDTGKAAELFCRILSHLEMQYRNGFVIAEILPDFYAVYGEFLKRNGLWAEQLEAAERGISYMRMHRSNWNLFCLLQLAADGWNKKESKAGLGRKDKEHKEAIEKELREWRGDKRQIYEFDILHNVYCSSEMLRSCRKASRMTQKAVMGEHCDVSQLSKIEQGKRKPCEKAFSGIMEAMNSKGNRMFCSLRNITYDQLVVQRDILISLTDEQYPAAQWKLHLLEQTLDMSQDMNQLFIYSTRSFIKVMLGEWKEAMLQGERALQLAVPRGVELEEWPLMKWERIALMVVKLAAEKMNRALYVPNCAGQ